MKTWMLSELFYPDETSTGYFMTKIAERLGTNNEGGIEVICGPEKYSSEDYGARDKLTDTVNIHRVGIPELDKNSLFQRTLRMMILSCKMAFKLLRKSHTTDKVFIVTNPAPLLVLVALVKKMKRFNLIIIVHDVFPENMLPSGIISSTSLVYKIIRGIFNFAYRQADQVITVGEDMNELLLEKTKFPVSKTRVITNWADCDKIYPLEFPDVTRMNNYYGNIDLSGKIVIQFAGNVGRLQALPEFLEIFIESKNPLLALIILGDGALKKELEENVSLKGIKNVHFVAPKSRADQNLFLNFTHIGLVSLNRGMYGLGVPSKSYNIWAAGKPVLFLGDKNSEIARNIAEHDSGWAFAWERSKLVEFLRGLNMNSLYEINTKGRLGRQSALTYFDREVILSRYEQI